jgi:hypothetical protein
MGSSYLLLSHYTLNKVSFSLDHFDGIIAVPTGIVTVELSEARRAAVSTRACPECAVEGHDPDARFCKACGAEL